MFDIFQYSNPQEVRLRIVLSVTLWPKMKMKTLLMLWKTVMLIAFSQDDITYNFRCAHKADVKTNSQSVVAACPPVYACGGAWFPPEGFSLECHAWDFSQICQYLSVLPKVRQNLKIPYMKTYVCLCNASLWLAFIIETGCVVCEIQREHRNYLTI